MIKETGPEVIEVMEFAQEMENVILTIFDFFEGKI